MNPATHWTEDNASAPVLCMALELSNTYWRLAFGDGAKRRQVSVPAADLAKFAQAVAKAKELSFANISGEPTLAAPMESSNKGRQRILVVQSTQD